MRGRVLALPLALAACATVTDPGLGQPVESLSYETGPCFGACPVYRVTVSRDGTGLFEGRRFTAVTGPRSFRLSPSQFEAFARQLAPLRPSRGEVRYAGESCAMTATDLPSAEVTWRSGSEEQRLYFYYGCDMERNQAIAERLSAAPALLPIGDFLAPPR
jgi:hypothetical protein